VKVTVGGTTVDAFMYYASATQVAAILPSNTPSGTGTVTVTYNGVTSATAPIRVVDASFGIFSLNQGGTGPGVFSNVNSATDLPVNTLTNSAKPGQTVIIWGTGLGPVTAANEAGAPAPGDLPTNVEVYIGGQRAAVSYKGRSGCCVGLDQIAATVPPNVEGCYVPVVVKTGDVVSNFTSLAVARNGGACTDVTGLTSAQLEAAQRSNNFRTGSIVLSRSITKIAIPGLGSAEIKADTGVGSFEAFNFDQLIRSGGVGASSGAVASPGACTVFSFTGTSPTPVDIIQPTPLDAGPVINITNATRGAKQLTKEASVPGTYTGQLSSGTPSIPGLPGGGGAADYLEPGSYTIDNGSGATGANAVGPFRVNITLPQLLTWTNMDATETINRSSDLLITWTGGDPSSYVFMVGAATTNNGGAAFTCIERASAGRFNVPSYVLSALPATSASSFGFLSVNSVTQPTTFTATGLDLGSVIGSAGASKTVTFR
jgi:uncharacterized protein (TIGR03437 family)